MVVNKETAVFEVDASQLYKGNLLNTDLLETIASTWLRHGQKRANKNYNYYIGKTEITKGKNGTLFADNKVTSNMPASIVRKEEGFILGKDVEFYVENSGDSTTDAERSALLKRFNEIASKTHLNDVIYNVVIKSGIYGIAYAGVYTDEDGELYVTKDEPNDDTFVLIDNTTKHHILGRVKLLRSINWADGSSTFVKLQVYTNNLIYTYSCSGAPAYTTSIQSGIGTLSILDLLSIENNTVSDNGFVYFQNNDEMIGSFEPNINQIDAMEKTLSNNVNESEKFARNIMIFRGDIGTDKMEGESDGQYADRIAKGTRVFNVDKDSDIEYLVKPNTSQENIALGEYIREELAQNEGFVFSSKSINGNTSALAIEMQLSDLKSRVMLKVNSLKRGLEKLNKIIVDYINGLDGTDYNYTDIKIKFHLNLPVDKISESQWAVNMAGILPIDVIIDNLSLSGNKEAIKKEALEQQAKANIEANKNIDASDQKLETDLGAKTGSEPEQKVDDNLGNNK